MKHVFDCPRCNTYAVQPDDDVYRCRECGSSWESLIELAETYPHYELANDD